MNNRSATVRFMVLILLLFVGCATRETAVPSIAGQGPPPVDKAITGATDRAAWEEEWGKILKAAKNERSVAVYASSPAPALHEIIPLFKQKYGLDLEVVSGTGPELSGKIIRERANGIYVADVIMSATNTTFGVIKPAGVLDPMEGVLILPEVRDPGMWHEGKLPWLDKDHMVFNYVSFPSAMLAINSTQVNPGEIKSFYDLLDPKWKNKIIINDPTITGSGFNAFASLLFNKVLDMDFFRQLVSQQNQMLRDQRLQVDWLARGKYPIALWPRSADVGQFKDAGAPLAWTNIKEGTYLSEAVISLANKSPHPNASKIFINWILTREPQTILQNYLQKQSARVDVPTDQLDQLKVRKPGEKYFMSASMSEEWVLKEQTRYLEIAKEVFKPLLPN